MNLIDRLLSEDPADKITKGTVFKILSIPLILIVLFLSIYVVKTGEVAVISKLGKVDRVEYPGLHFKIPIIESKQSMIIKERTVKFGPNEKTDDFTTIEVSSRDLQTIDVEIAVSNTITDPLLLFNKFTGNHLTSMMAPRIRDAVQSQVAKYTIEEFIAKRDQLAADIFKDLENQFTPYGIQLTNIAIVNHDFDDEYDQAVRMKKVAQQAVETERATQEKLLVEAEAKLKLMDFRIQEKQKQNEANKVEALSLTPELLQKMFIEKWNGELPRATSGSNILLPSEFLSPSP